MRFMILLCLVFGFMLIVTNFILPSDASINLASRGDVLLKKNYHKTIGIIGGADPAASCLLYKKIIEKCLNRFDCKHGEDFPEIMIVNYPFGRLDDITDAEKNKTQLCAQLQYSIDKLNKYPVSIFAIACNTLHTFLNDINFHELKLVHIAKETLAEAQRRGCSKLLVLATQTTIKKDLYKQVPFEIISPNEQDQVLLNQIIDRVEQNKILEQDAKQLISLINDINKQAAFEGVVLGCTELSVLYEAYPEYFSENSLKIAILDTTSILAQSLVSEAFKI